MGTTFTKTHELMLTKFRETVGADEKAVGFYIVHKNQGFTVTKLLEAIRKTDSNFEGIETANITIVNPDTKETQSLSDFVEYINENGLGAWDSGEGDED